MTSPTDKQSTNSLENANNNHLVPETLLAFAKDARYVHQCQELVSNALGGLTTGWGHDEIENKAGLISTILFMFTVLARKGRTLGMEACGLDWDKSAKLSRGVPPHWKVFVGSLLGALAVYWGLEKTRSHHQELESTGSLRGSSRREAYLAQRRAMMERANNIEANESTQSANSNHRRGATSMVESLTRLVSSMLGDLLSTGNYLADDTSPHGLHRPQGRVLSIGLWLFRLHLAFFCLDGRYASLTYRLLGVRLRQSGDSRIHRPTTSSRVVGLLLLSHVAASLANETARRLIRWWWLWSNTSQRTPKEPLSSIRWLHEKGDQEALSEVKTRCTICHRQRLHPACPVSCGHVVCWSCLIQWVTAVRPHCPICRAPCKGPQDIMTLQNYSTRTFNAA